MWKKFVWRNIHCNNGIISEKRKHHKATLHVVMHEVLDENWLNRMQLRAGRRRGMKQIVYYWYTFEDGYRCCVRGFSSQEFQNEIDKHGMMIKKEMA